MEIEKKLLVNRITLMIPIKYKVTIIHDNRARTLTMEFKNGKINLGMTADYFLDKSPSYADVKGSLETAAISTVTAYDALGEKGYEDMCRSIGTMAGAERQALLSTITAKHPKGLLPEIVYKEI